MKHLVLIFLSIFITSEISSQNYIFYSYSEDPWTFNSNLSDGSDHQVVYLTSTSLVYASATDASLSKVYFYDSDVSAILRADYDGTSRETIKTVSTNVKLAAGNGYLYYAYTNNPYSIRRINSDKTGDTQIYLNESNGFVYEIAVDIANSYLYFYEYSYDGTNHRIARTDLDGNNLIAVYNNCPRIYGLAAGSNYFFYSSQDGTRKLYRRDSDGNNEVEIYDPGSGSVQECCYDENLEKIYFYDTTPKEIYQCDLDGSNTTKVFDGFTQSLTSLCAPTGNDPSIVPVELVAFSAVLDEGKVFLNWETATEINNYGFEIERGQMLQPLESFSQEGEIMEWNKIGFIHGNGNSNSPKKYEFMDENPPEGQLEYRLKQIDIDGRFEFYGTIAEVNNSITGIPNESLPGEFGLSQNYPNPFNPSTNIDFEIPEDGYVEIALYDINGRELQKLLNENKKRGPYKLSVNMNSYASGVYLYQLKCKDYSHIRKMVLIR